jgi:RimJ/RimL family protein N-acetyltransferase
MMNAGRPSEYVIRPAIVDDVAELVELGNRLEGEAEFMLGSAVDPVSGARLIKASLEDAAPGQARSRVFVAEADGDIVGICLCRELSHPAQHGVVQLGLGVDESHRRLGMGRALTEFALDWAASADVHRVQLTVIKANTPAVTLYKEAGFVIEGTLNRAVKIDGRVHDLYVMAKLLT